MGPPLGVLPSHRGGGSHVPHKSLRWAHAAFMPVIARAVGRLPPSFVPGQQLEPGFDDVPTLSTRHQRFTRVRLPSAHLTGSSRLFRNAHHPGHWAERSFRWFGPWPCSPSPRGRPSSLVQQGCFRSAVLHGLLSAPSWRTVVRVAHHLVAAVAIAWSSGSRYRLASKGLMTAPCGVPASGVHCVSSSKMGWCRNTRPARAPVGR